MAFWNRKPAPIEAKSLAAPDAELLAILGATVAGTAAVGASTALTVPAVGAAVRVISEAAATLPVTVKRKVGGVETDVPDHSALKLLTGQANPWTSGFELIRDLVAAALTRDVGGLAYVNRVGGETREIINYQPTAISVAYEDTGEPIYRLSGRIVPASDIVHVRGTFSKCPLTQFAEAIGVAHVLEKHAAALFTNGARPGGVLESPKPLGETGVTKMLQGWQAAFGGATHAGKTPVLWDGTTFKPLTFSSVDAQFLEMRRFQIGEVARAFRVPPQMLFDLERATWSNAEQMAREFLTYCLQPWLRALEGAFNRALLTDEERGEYRFAFDIDDTTQADLTARAAAISTLITTRVLNPNEARDWLGMPPREGGEEYANPNTGSNQPAPANDNTPERDATNEGNLQRPGT